MNDLLSLNIIGNVFKEDELTKNSVCAKYAHTAADGKTYHVEYYNLDVVISVGYRVKSQRGVQFRQWATQTLNDYARSWSLLQGYDEQSLKKKRISKMQCAL